MPDVHQAEEDLVNKEQVRAFVAQLELRKHLDTVYTELDRQGYQESEYDYLHTVIRFIDRYIEVDTAGIDSALSNLQDTITKLNRRLWDIYRTHQPKETSSKSLLAIRVKAKFVAAMAFTARPYLMMILGRGVGISEKVGKFVKHCITLLEQSAMASNSIKDDRLITHA
jgi:hypothetical protein